MLLPGMEREIFQVNEKHGRRQILSCFFQSENKFCSNALGTDHINVLIMSMDDLFYNRQTKTGTFLVFSSGNICFIKAFPDFGKAFLWNADSVVFDRNKNLFIFFLLSQ